MANEIPDLRIDQPPGIEIPQAAPVEARPAEIRPQPYPPSAGYTGGLGAGAAIAGSVLEGWLAGKRLKEQRLQNQAQAEIQGARSIYVSQLQNWRNWRASNPTPDQKADPQGFATWQAENEKYKNSALAGRKAYLSSMEPFLFGGQEEKGKKKGGILSRVGRGAKRALGAPSPELVPQTAYDWLKNSDISLQAQPSPLESAESSFTKSRAELAQEEVKQKKTQEKSQQMILDANQAAVNAMASNDPDKIASALNTVSALSGSGKYISPDEIKERQVEVRLASEKSATLGDIFGKVKSGKQLDENEQAIWNASWGITPEKNVEDAYLADVGPGKRFKDKYEAARAYLQDQSAFRYAYRPEDTNQMLESAVKLDLEGKLGREPTQQEVAQGILEWKWGKRGGAGGAGAKLTATQQRNAMNQAINAATNKNGKWGAFVLESAGGTLSITPFGNASGGKEVAGGESAFAHPGFWGMGKVPDTTSQEFAKFVDTVRSNLKAEGLSDDQIDSMYSLPPSPAAQPQPMTPRPEAAATKRYYVYKGTLGNGTYRDLSPAQASKLTANGFKVVAQEGAGAPSR